MRWPGIASLTSSTMSSSPGIDTSPEPGLLPEEFCAATDKAHQDSPSRRRHTPCSPQGLVPPSHIIQGLLRDRYSGNDSKKGRQYMLKHIA